MSLKNEIENYLVEYAIRMESPIIVSTATGRFADDILGVIREAMLSDEAIETAAESEFMGDWDDTTEFLQEVSREASDCITAAWDAVTGDTDANV